MVLLNHSLKNKGVFAFQNAIISKVNVITRLKFELSYYDVAV